jgi:GTP-binding protein
MKIKKAEFLISNTELKKCPPADKPEYAFIGRSNVGKSSLINMLTGRKNLAKISGKPGKTRLINHFAINDNWYLVDLPGYGYAKISETEKNKWSKFIHSYITERENLACLFVLVDSRLSPQKIDLEFITKLGIAEIPFVIVFTKSDKLSKSGLSKNISKYKAELSKSWEIIPGNFISSSITGYGKEELLDFIEKTNSIVNK